MTSKQKADQIAAIIAQIEEGIRTAKSIMRNAGYSPMPTWEEYLQAAISQLRESEYNIRDGEHHYSAR